MNDYVAILTELGSAGLLATALVWAFKYFVPKLIDRQDEALKAQRDAFSKMEARQRADYLAASQAMRDDLKDAIASLAEEQKETRKTQTDMIAVTSEQTATMKSLEAAINRAIDFPRVNGELSGRRGSG
jgi:vacuolar-type H+-ATPase subunit I/STV1